MLQRTAVSLASSYYRTIEACDFFKYSLMASYNLLSFQTVTAFIPARAPEKIRHLPLIKWHSRKTVTVALWLVPIKHPIKAHITTIHY